MRARRDKQAKQLLSYPLRLPDEIQADALRLLDVSREAINRTVAALWDRLDEFSTRTSPYAYKQVEEMLSPPLAHGHRQWRCEAEQAGRILRGQAARKQQFALIHPVLTHGMIQPKTNAKRGGKNRQAIKQAVRNLREADSDGGNSVELQGLIEQACNYYLQYGCFPDTYEEMQPIPILKAGILPYAGDDGPQMGQTYRMNYDLAQQTLTLALRTPDEHGAWARTWREHTIQLQLPDIVVTRARAGSPLAPSLREIVEVDRNRYAVLDFVIEVLVDSPVPAQNSERVLGFDWGVRVLVTASAVDLDDHQIGRPFFLDTGPFDGRQARLRRQIDRLKVKVARLEQQRERFPEDNPKRQPGEKALRNLHREISRCWRKYEARNNDLAHLAANCLLMLAAAFDCQLIAGESLKSLKSAGRGRGAKGRWRNWRNNTQVRGELWRVLRYKCSLAGVRLEWQQPRDTSHVCPRCGRPANTYASPEHRSYINDWGAWLYCSNPACLWNGSRDYAASINIARLGATWIRHARTAHTDARVPRPQITDPSVQPVSYMGTWAALRLPPLVLRDHLMHSGRIYCNGWRLFVKLRSSYATPIIIRLCGLRQTKLKMTSHNSRF